MGREGGIRTTYGLTLRALVFSIAMLGSSAVSAGTESLRVKVFEGPLPLEIGSARGPVLVRRGAAGISVDGRVLERARTLGAAGPYSVGGVRYRGTLTLLRHGNGLLVVNEVELEDYVAGTILREMTAGWEVEALRAQAVVTRTYALHQKQRRSADLFHLGDGTAYQVYGGVDAESEISRRVAAETRGQFLSHRGAPILAAFHSASGGRTASAEEVWGTPVPYLVSLDVPVEEDVPETYWRTRVARDALRAALVTLGVRVGEPRLLTVTSRGESGRVRTLRLVGSEGEVEVEARALRRAVGARDIRSTLFDVHEEAGVFVFVGSGYGHGVGMSQWGARAQAVRGLRYTEILARFYPGTTLERPRGQTHASARQQTHP